MTTLSSTITLTSSSETEEESPPQVRRKKFCRSYRSLKARLEERERRSALRQIALWRKTSEYPKEWRRFNSDEEIEELLQLEESIADDIYWRNLEITGPELFVEMQQADAQERMEKMHRTKIARLDITPTNANTSSSSSTTTTTTKTTTATTTSNKNSQVSRRNRDWSSSGVHQCSYMFLRVAWISVANRDVFTE